LDPPAILKLHDKAELDLSAIAKGFAVDFVAEYLSEQGATDFQVEVGGEVAVRGLTPRGVWRIGIEKPDGSSSPVAVARLTDVALATSGDYRNFYEIDGKRYSHTIDPKTCCPVENPPASCSVLYPDCMTADALATALMVMSEKAAEKFCIQNNVAALIYRRLDGSPGQYKEFRSAGFPITDNVEATREQHKSRSIWPAFVGALVVFTLAVAGMAVGAIFNNRPIRGSCGGSASNTNLDGSSSCSLCSKPVTDCPEQSVAKKR
jgi:thiamine biosynthesis lipoprotein